jgi:ferredoxin
MARLDLDTDRCQGHGQCVMAAPEFFSFDEQGFAVLGSAEVPPDLEAKAQAAVSRCPERAISIANESSSD